MGCSYSKHKDFARKRSMEIDNKLKEWKQIEEKNVKILLLGDCQSGKSNIMKMLKIKYGGGFTKDDLDQYKHVIREKTVNTMVNVLKGMIGMGFMFDREDTKKMMEASTSMVISDELLLSMDKLMRDSEAKNCLAKYADLEQDEKYWLDNFERVSNVNYVPNEQDILHAYIPTTKFTSISFSHQDHWVEVVEVGSLNLLSRRFTYLFDSTTIVYCFDISKLNHVTTKLQEESIETFKKFCYSIRKYDILIIVLFTKIDLFRDKLSRQPNFKGEKDYHQAITRVEDQFRYIFNNVFTEYFHSPYIHFEKMCMIHSELSLSIGTILDFIIKVQPRSLSCIGCVGLA